MEIEDIQKRVLEFEKRWEEAKNIKFDVDLTMLHLTEEIGELSQQLFYKKAKPERYNEEKVKEELCDVMSEIFYGFLSILKTSACSNRTLWCGGTCFFDFSGIMHGRQAKNECFRRIK